MNQTLNQRIFENSSMGDYRRGMGGDRGGFGAFPGRGYDRRDEPRGGGSFGRRDDSFRDRDFNRLMGRRRRVNPNLIDLDPNVIPLDKRPRRINNWDDKPTGLDGVAAVDMLILSGIHVIPYEISKECKNEAEKSAIIASIFNTIQANKTDEVSKEMKARCKQMLLLDLSENVTEEDIKEWFKNMLTTYRCIPSNSKPPVKSAEISKGKALVEFRSAEEATAALAFDGALFKGRHLRIRRPKEFIPLPNEPLEPPSINIAGITSSYVPNTYNRVVIGGIPKNLSDKQLIQLLEVFGDLRAFSLVRNPQTKEWNGYAFCEFVDLTLTDLVCDGINGLEIEDSQLKVQRSTRNCPRIELSSVIPHMIPNTLLGPISTSVEPTNIVQLLNVLSLADIEDEEEYRDILDDIRDEAIEFGRVDSVMIPRPFDECYYPGTGKIYIVYETVDAAKRAVEGFAGRIYFGRVIFSSFYPVFKYECFDF